MAPMDKMAGLEEVGYIAAVYAFGDVGGAIMGLTLSLLLISRVSAMIMAAPKVYHVAGQEFKTLGFFSKTNKHNIPRNATLLQGGLTLLFLWTASFHSILVFAGQPWP